jgi:DmsE family decaheme c-type cytochrome
MASYFRPLAAGLLVAGWAAAQEPKLPDGYAGTETCAVCHEDIAKAFARNPHSLVDSSKMRGWTARACESCHGPGAKHAESSSAADIINPLKAPIAKADKTCLGCHLNQPTHAGRIVSGHARNQVTCANCHTVHGSDENKLQVKYKYAQQINRKCASCHLSVWAQFQRPHAHRLKENSMSCVDCHNPHGNFNARQIASSSAGEKGCFTCHADKRGPFVFQHAPVRTEPCSACHEPHGSVNPRMLTRAQAGLLCLECHSNIVSPSPAGQLGGVPPAFHDTRSPRYRNCTTCHQKIHGSNVNKGFLR